MHVLTVGLALARAPAIAASVSRPTSTHVYQSITVLLEMAVAVSSHCVGLLVRAQVHVIVQMDTLVLGIRLTAFQSILVLPPTEGAV